MVNIDVRIGELVLHGFAVSRRAAIEESFRAELELLLTERVRSEPDAFRTVHSPRELTSIRLSASASDAAVGRQIAAATLRGINAPDGAGGQPGDRGSHAGGRR